MSDAGGTLAYLSCLGNNFIEQLHGLQTGCCVVKKDRDSFPQPCKSRQGNQCKIIFFLAGKLYELQLIPMADANPSEPYFTKGHLEDFLRRHVSLLRGRPHETLHVQETVTERDEQKLHLVKLHPSKSIDYYGTTLKTSSPGRTRSETLTPI
jgi:hypothetical protein